jgi:hypothetical protein
MRACETRTPSSPRYPFHSGLHGSDAEEFPSFLYYLCSVLAPAPQRGRIIVT